MGEVFIVVVHHIINMSACLMEQGSIYPYVKLQCKLKGCYKKNNRSRNDDVEEACKKLFSTSGIIAKLGVMPLEVTAEQ